MQDRLENKNRPEQSEEKRKKIADTKQVRQKLQEGKAAGRDKERERGASDCSLLINTE